MGHVHPAVHPLPRHRRRVHRSPLARQEPAWPHREGESLAVIGGPKLGKTSLVRTALEGLSDRTVVEVDCGTDPSPRLDVLPGSIVVLDKLDNVAGPAIEPLLARLSAAGAAGLVVTGGHRLRTLMGHSGTLAAVTFQLYPLSVLLEGDMRRLIGRDRSPYLAVLCPT